MSNCQLCGSPVSINGAEATCVSCGAEYDVIRHGRRGDFSKSVEKAVNAVKIPTVLAIYPQEPDSVSEITGSTQFVGKKMKVRVVLDVAGGGWVSNKVIDIYHKVDTGAWEKIGSPTQGAVGVYADLPYTLAVAGKHTFYGEFVGDATYAGCPSTVHGLTVGADYGVSIEKAVFAQPALTVIVKDMIFKKPIEGAKVVIDTFEALTDSSGMAVFDALTPATYTLSVSARDYKSETRTVELTTLGMVVEVHLIHLAAIALGIVSAASVGLIVAHKVLKRK